jgi:hypothetical protein
MGRAAPPDAATYEKLMTVLRMIEERGAAIAAEHGLNVQIESNRGGKFPYLTFRAFGFLPAEDEDDELGAAE